ncbi:MAG: copper chaperone PCu(A)C [Actinomycetota bacterium]|nr:copper chaperone PCu(A)C [Actinomycetota bacterium]
MTRLTTPRSFFRLAAATATVGALVLAAGCSDDDKADPTTTSEPAAEITFEGQWARTSPAAVTAGAAYVTITSPIDDVLLDVSVDASVAAMAQIHEMVMAESTDTTMDMGSETTMGMGSETTMGMGSDTTMAMGDGEMVMREVDSIDLPAGVAVELKPGGYHIMLMELAKPLEVGTTLKITLVFENAGSITIDVPVLDEAP